MRWSLLRRQLRRRFSWRWLVCSVVVVALMVFFGCAGYVSGHFGASWPVGGDVPAIEHGEGA